MSRKLSLSALMLLLIVTLAACGQAPATDSSTAAGGNSTEAGSNSQTDAEVAELVITHQLGETVVPKNPEKLVVFDFGILDSLDKLGIEVTGVPQANIPPYLAKYEDSKYEHVGSLKEPDFEKISEIAPDLIIISGRQQEAYDELTKLGPTIFLGVDTTRYLESFVENMQVLAQIFDKEEEINAELATIEAEIQELNEVATGAGNALIILANDGNISAYGPGSRFGIIHDEFGFAAVDENIKVSTHGDNISYEFIVEKNPDYLFVIDRGAVVSGGESSAKQIIENELIQTTKAYQNDQIIYLDPNYWYLSGGGLISVSEMVREVAEGIK